MYNYGLLVCFVGFLVGFPHFGVSNASDEVYRGASSSPILDEAHESVSDRGEENEQVVIHALSAQLEEYREEIEILQKEINEYAEVTVKKNETLEKLANKVFKLNEEKKELKSRLKELVENFEVLKTGSNVEIAGIANALLNKNDLESEIAVLKSEFSKLRNREEEMVLKLKQMEDQKTSVVKENDKLKKEQEDNRAKYEKTNFLLSENIQLKATCALLEEQILNTASSAPSAELLALAEFMKNDQFNSPEAIAKRAEEYKSREAVLKNSKEILKKYSKSEN